MLKLFVAGTDTNVGKTFVTVRLLKSLQARGWNTMGIKPIASGCETIKGAFCNSDALAIQEAASIKLAYHAVNPFAFQPAIAPHIAAKRANTALTVERVVQKITEVTATQADVCLIEGVGGWQVPLNDQELMSDVVCALKMPVLLVSAIQLGCLNHTLLTVNAIQNAGVPLWGWVANCRHPHTEAIADNIATLQARISAPCLGVIPYLECA